MAVEPTKNTRATAKKARNANPQDERRVQALGKIAKNFRRLNVAQRRRGPQFLPVLLALLGLAISALMIFGPKKPKEVIPEFPATAPMVEVNIPVDPVKHRPALEAFERVLFGRADAGPSGLREGLASAAKELDASLRPVGSPSALRLADFLADSAQRLSSAPEFSLVDLAELRARWLAVRGRDLQAADFLATVQADPGRDAATISVYRELLGALEGQVARAGGLYAVIDDPEAEPTARRGALEQAAKDFAAELRTNRLRLPARPTLNETSDAMMVAINELERAFDEVASLGNADSWSPDRFEAVRQRLGKARTALLDAAE